MPGMVEIRQLEFLVQQAATAIESAEVYDNLARNNAELALASDKLNSLTDMKNNFVANVSHELRTPLTSISAYTELLQKNLDDVVAESLEEFLKVIHTESVKLSDIINDILELSQMENGPARPWCRSTPIWPEWCGTWRSPGRAGRWSATSEFPVETDLRQRNRVAGRSDAHPATADPPGGQRVQIHARGRHA